jgi:hypothetical protein
MPYLGELQLVNITKGGSFALYNSLLSSIIQKGRVLRKLQLSRIDLSQIELIYKICEIIEIKQ